ncbi:MAG: FHA domain-containing protein [Acidobacteriota bacterium]
MAMFDRSRGDGARSMPRSGVLTFLVALGLLGVSGVVRSQSPGPSGSDGPGTDAAAPVVVAVDTSRSLDSGSLGEVVDRLRLALEGLDADAPVGLLAFDDEPRWLKRPGATPGEVAAALGELRLQGDYTLLNDALFVATRELPEGGVVLLATDGRDENSATTVDDLARRCEALGIRILSVGTGRGVEERFLRRLALISNGSYLGDVSAVDASEVARAVSSARTAVSKAAPRGPAAPATAAATSAPQGGPAEGSPPVASDPGASGASTGSGASPSPAGQLLDGQRTWLAPTALALGAVALLLIPFLLRSRRRVTPEEDEAEGSDPDDEEIAADEAEAEMLRLELTQAEAASQRDAPEVTVDTAVFQKLSLEERLDRTRVLSQHSVLAMRKPGEAPRSFLLDDDKAFAVGRDRQQNTLSVPDPALSSQHFKVVPRDGAHFFVDLESTNGSWIGGRRVGAKRLRSGDVIRAGQVEFEYQTFS